MSLVQDTETLLADAVYTLTYSTLNAMANGGAFKVTYPPEVEYSGTLSTCEVAYSGITYTMSSCSVDTTTRVITVAGGFTPSVPLGGSIAIKLGLITNPEMQYATTFSILSYTADNFLYEVDEVISGLIP
jgi:hypothetical protein